MSLSLSSFFVSSYGQIGVPTWRKVLDKTIDAGSLDTGTLTFASSDLLNVRVMATLCIDNIASDEEINMRFNGSPGAKIAYKRFSNFATVSGASSNTGIPVGINAGNAARSIDMVYEPDRRTGYVNIVSYAADTAYSDQTFWASDSAITRIEFYGAHSWATATYARLKVFELGV